MASPLDSVPIFPLPRCVLFPSVVLPLHVFEPRYRDMVRDVVELPEQERLIAIALLQTDFEPLYHTKVAPIYPEVCVGRVLEHVELPDGRFQLLLLGAARATVLEEHSAAAYRRGRLTPMPTESDLADEERDEVVSEVRTLLEQASIDPFDNFETFDKLADAADMGTFIDLLTFYILQPEDSELKQRVLAEPLLSVRWRILRKYLASMARRQGRSGHSGPWPPPPSLN